jgi:hypothetical protein
MLSVFCFAAAVDAPEVDSDWLKLEQLITRTAEANKKQWLCCHSLG